MKQDFEFIFSIDNQRLIGAAVLIMVSIFFVVFKIKCRLPGYLSKFRLCDNSQRVISLVEDEHRRMAGELHDEIGTLLTLVKSDLLDVFQGASTEGDKAILHRACANLDHTIDMLRNKVWLISPLALEKITLDDALRELCEKLNQAKGMHFYFVRSGPIRTMKREQTLYLFRISQELLHNALKHSRAKNVVMHIHYGTRDLQIIVEDDGTQPDMHVGHGLGLLMMEWRAKSIGASIVKEMLPHGHRVTVGLDL